VPLPPKAACESSWEAGVAAAGALEAGVLVTLAKGTASGTEEEERRLLLLSDGEAGLQWSSKDSSAQHQHSTEVQTILPGETSQTEPAADL